MHRVVVTGLGCVSPIGVGVDAFRASLDAGITGIAPFAAETFPGLRFTHLGQVRDFVPAEHLAASQLALAERSAQFALASAAQAAREGDLMAHHAPEATAIVVGCSCGGRMAEEPEIANLYTRGARIHPLTVARVMASSGASQVAIQHGITGPVLTLSTACASSTHAIGLAFHMVRSGMAGAALTGGHEAPLTWAFLRGWDSMRVVSPTVCRPFSADRDGMSLAEGAAMLAIETMESAQARGAHIYAEIVGFGMSSDAHHITQPQSDGAASAIRSALADAATVTGASAHGLAARVGYINAHGTGTRANDAAEAEAIRKVFGPLTAGIATGSTKGLHGHSIGASGAVEAVATVLALHSGRLPGNAALTDPDASLQLDLITSNHRMMPADRDLALSNSLAFGGLNAVLAFRRWSESQHGICR